MSKLTRLIAASLAALLLAGTAGCSAGDLADAVSSASNAVSSQTAPDAGAQWSVEKYPDYYAVAGKADFSGMDVPATPGVRYAKPDRLGRAGRAVALIDKAMRDAGSDRDRDMPDAIAGWPKPNPKAVIDLGGGRTYKGYLFNKSHLIAKSLGGADSPDNMVTGTRTQNVGRNQPAGGMAYTETLARDWLDGHPDGTVMYAATPNYTGDELLPRTVTVDIRTSDGSVDRRVTVFNTANGYDIDYLKGGVK